MRVLLVALAACGTNTVVVTPVIEVPANDSSSGFPVDSVTLAVAHEGEDTDLSSATFTKGQTIELSGVPFGDDLVIHMTGHIGTSEVAYGRTCAFSVTATAAPSSPHLFFSRSVKFAELGYTPEFPRVGGNAVTYIDGSGLIMGGIEPNDNAANTDLERLDPSTGEFRVIGTLQARIGAMAALLGTTAGETRIVLIGGKDPVTSLGAGFVEVLHPGSTLDPLVSVADSQVAREGMTATTLTDGRVIAIGGKEPGMPVASLIDEILLQSGTALVHELQSQLVHARYQHTATRLGNDVGAPVLIAGGIDDTGAPIAEAELFNPLAGNHGSATANFKMNIPRYHHQAVRMQDGSVLIIGGLDAAGNAVRTMELYTRDAGFKRVQQDLPGDAGVVDFTATALPDGSILLTGGKAFPLGAPLDAAFKVTPSVDQQGMSSVEALPTDHLLSARAGHQATLLCDGTVLITGGTGNVVAAELYNPLSTGRR